MSSMKSRESLEVTFQNQDQYIYSLTQNIVDNVCLYTARVDAIKREYRHKVNEESEEHK